MANKFSISYLFNQNCEQFLCNRIQFNRWRHRTSIDGAFSFPKSEQLRNKWIEKNSEKGPHNFQIIFKNTVCFAKYFTEFGFKTQ